MSSLSTKTKQGIRIGLILLILAILLITNYTEIKSGFIDVWNSTR